MSREGIIEYEWHIPDRVYVIRIEGAVTVNLMAGALTHVLSILDAASESKQVHLIYHIEKVHLEPAVPLPYIVGVTAELYRHPNTASLISVIGLNRLHAFLANSVGKAYSRENQQGQAVGTFNDALRLLAVTDPSLPIVNV